mmetsp:Transcript_34555/g.97922  ORF Transcript_34555/g.97922 Transcript_34555/m.97922 type:complete len:246 (+) Transcript_34555:191-928(+)
MEGAPSLSPLLSSSKGEEHAVLSALLTSTCLCYTETCGRGWLTGSTSCTLSSPDTKAAALDNTPPRPISPPRAKAPAGSPPPPLAWPLTAARPPWSFEGAAAAGTSSVAALAFLGGSKSSVKNVWKAELKLRVGSAPLAALSLGEAPTSTVNATSPPPGLGVRSPAAGRGGWAEPGVLWPKALLFALSINSVLSSISFSTTTAWFSRFTDRVWLWLSASLQRALAASRRFFTPSLSCIRVVITSD